MERLRRRPVHPVHRRLLLAQASLYWFTDTISTSFRPYFERGHGGRPPRSWVERTFHLTRYTTMPRGGHFAAHEEPALLADDITAFIATTA